MKKKLSKLELSTELSLTQKAEVKFKQALVNTDETIWRYIFFRISMHNNIC